MFSLTIWWRGYQTSQSEDELKEGFLETLDMSALARSISAAAPSLRFIAFHFRDNRTYWAISPEEDGNFCLSQMEATKATEIFGKAPYYG